LLDRLSQLADLAGTRHATPLLAGTIDGRQQQADEHSNDGDDDKQFDQGETALFRPATHKFLLQSEAAIIRSVPNFGF
jgi:hypothetical protein